MALANEQPAQKSANRRLGLILGSIALAFFVGVIVKFFLLGR